MAQRVVLIHPPPFGEVPFRHIGLAYLQAVLLDAGLDTVLCDLSAAENEAGTDVYDDMILHMSRRVGDISDGLDPRLLMEVLHPEMFDDPTPLSRAIIRQVDARLDEAAALGDVFLFSVNIITYYFASRMGHRLRAMGKRTAVGGPSIRFGPIRNLLLRSGAFDAAFVGEGEGAVTQLVDGLRRGKLEGVSGTAFIDEREELREGPPAPAPEVDGLLHPWFEPDQVRDFMPILGARGCPVKCTYCSEPFHWGGHRRRPPGQILAEMDRAADRYGSSNFHFHDDLINGHIPWFDALVDGLIERGGRYRWESFCGPIGFDKARLERMRESGCVLLKMGVQSF
ncbi:MAG: B12-binding domain-containing radical SAM protein, partial [Planctomycetota bacterium]